MKLAPTMAKDELIVVCLSGREGQRCATNQRNGGTSMKPLTLYLENQTTKPLFIPYIMAGAQGPRTFTRRNRDVSKKRSNQLS